MPWGWCLQVGGLLTAQMTPLFPVCGRVFSGGRIRRGPPAGAAAHPHRLDNCDQHAHGSDCFSRLAVHRCYVAPRAGCEDWSSQPARRSRRSRAWFSVSGVVRSCAPPRPTGRTSLRPHYQRPFERFFRCPQTTERSAPPMFFTLHPCPGLQEMKPPALGTAWRRPLAILSPHGLELIRAAEGSSQDLTNWPLTHLPADTPQLRDGQLGPDCAQDDLPAPPARGTSGFLTARQQVVPSTHLAMCFPKYMVYPRRCGQLRVNQLLDLARHDCAEGCC
jgi:hypothetical protein